MPCLISGSDVLLSSTVCTLRGKISATDPTGVVEILFPPQVKGLMGETRPPAGILEHGRGIPKLSNPHVSDKRYKRRFLCGINSHVASEAYLLSVI